MWRAKATGCSLERDPFADRFVIYTVLNVQEEYRKKMGHQSICGALRTAAFVSGHSVHRHIILWAIGVESKESQKNE